MKNTYVVSVEWDEVFNCKEEIEVEASSEEEAKKLAWKEAKDDLSNWKADKVKKKNVTIDRLINVTYKPHPKRVAGTLPKPSIPFRDLFDKFDTYKNPNGDIAVGIESLEQFNSLRIHLEKLGYKSDKYSPTIKEMEESLMYSWETIEYHNFIGFEKLEDSDEYSHVDVTLPKDEEYISCWFFDLIFDESED